LPKLTAALLEAHEDLMNRYTVLLVTICIFATATPDLSAESPGSYAIRFVRPAKAGDRYSITVKGWDHNKDQTTSVSNGAVLAKTDHRLDVEVVAFAEVKSVDQESQPNRIAYNIKQCLATEDGKTRELLPKGSQLVVQQSGKDTTFMVDGKPAKPEIDGALRVVLFLGESGTPTDDDLYGTNEKKRVGDQWSINKDKAVLAFKKMGVTPQALDISGTVRLDGMRKEGDIDVLELSSKMELWTSTREKTTKLQTRYWVLLPVNPEGSIVEQSMQLALGNRRRVVGKTGMDAIYETTLESGYEARYSPLTVSQSPASLGNPGR
jgi:hypothetical protein